MNLPSTLERALLCTHLNVVAILLWLSLPYVFLPLNLLIAICMDIALSDCNYDQRATVQPFFSAFILADSALLLLCFFSFY